MEEEYMISLFAKYDDQDDPVEVCTMSIPVPDDADPEEYIDEFLDDILSYDFYQIMEWDFV